MNKTGEFRVIKLTQDFELLSEIAISRKIFCHPDYVHYFKPMIANDSDIYIVTDNRILPMYVILARDCELKQDGLQLGYDFGDFENNQCTVRIKYVIV